MSKRVEPVKRPGIKLRKLRGLRGLSATLSKCVLTKRHGKNEREDKGLKLVRVRLDKVVTPNDIYEHSTTLGDRKAGILTK